MTQYSSKTQQYLPQNKSIFEVVMIAGANGEPINSQTAIPVEFSEKSADAFGRARTSTPFTLGDYKHTYQDIGDFLTHAVDGGIVNYPANKAATNLETNTLATSRIVYQSKVYHHYLPGKSQLIYNSFCFKTIENSSKKRIGYFDDLNGIFLELEVDAVGVPTLKLVLRSNVTGSVVDTEITQENWNIDKCDSTGISEFDLDVLKTQLLFVDYQWLGVGRVRCGFVHDGKLVLAHEFKHSNILNRVYWSNPNLPIRSEVLNTAVNSGASMHHICSTVISEGGYIEAGIDWQVQSPSKKLTQKPGGTWTPILAIRLKNDFNGNLNRALLKPENVGLYADVHGIAYQIGKLSNASDLGGSLPLIWSSVNDLSVAEYCINAETVVMANLEILGGGFVAAGQPQGAPTTVNPGVFSQSRRNYITQNFDSTDSEVYVIVAKTLTLGVNDQAEIWSSLQWKEIL